MVRKALLLAMVVGCAGGQESKGSTTTPGATGGAGEFPETIGAARTDLEKSAKEVDASLSDCQTACKALASLERSVNRLCMVAQPEECSDARVRFDQARRAVLAQCGGC
jgi:hypothetical protein